MQKAPDDEEDNTNRDTIIYSPVPTESPAKENLSSESKKENIQSPIVETPTSTVESKVEAKPDLMPEPKHETRKTPKNPKTPTKSPKAIHATKTSIEIKENKHKEPMMTTKTDDESKANKVLEEIQEEQKGSKDEESEMVDDHETSSEDLPTRYDFILKVTNNNCWS